MKGVPLLLTQSGRLCAFGERNPRFSTDRELLPNYPDKFIHKSAWNALVTPLAAEALSQEDLQSNIPDCRQNLGVRGLRLEDLEEYKDEVETLAKAPNGNSHQNGYLPHLLRFMSKASSISSIFDSWQLLPIYNKSSRAEVVPLNCASQTVAICSERQNQVSTALLHAGIFLLQDWVSLEFEKYPFLQRRLITSDKNVVKVLLEANKRGGLSSLTGEDRHAMLTYLSSLVIDSVDFSKADIRKLPLFKLAQGGTFSAVCEPGITYCSLPPEDRHAGALERLMPISSVLLSWPTQSIKPIYEHLGIRLCNGEDFMINFVLPNLPQACQETNRAKPYLDVLQEFVVNEKSDGVTKAARGVAFVPTLGGTSSKASELLDKELAVVQCFQQCLQEQLPADWIQTTYPELLKKLGLRKFVPSASLLKCAQELDGYKAPGNKMILLSFIDFCRNHLVQ